MALLTELDKIERDSTADPGDPADAEIVAARALRAKIRAAILIHAKTLLTGARLPINGRTDYPETAQEINEAIAWAQRVMSSVDAMLPAAFRIGLASAEAQTKANLLTLGTSTDPAVDTTLRNALIPLLPLLAKGMHPGR